MKGGISDRTIQITVEAPQDSASNHNNKTLLHNPNMGLNIITRSTRFSITYQHLGQLLETFSKLVSR